MLLDVIAFVVVWCALVGVGILLHEPAHWLTWRLCGRDARIVSLRQVERPATAPDRVDALAAASPALWAVAFASLAVATGVLLVIPLSVGLVIGTDRQDPAVFRAGLSAGR